MDCTVHEILQARILEWVAIPVSRGIFPTQGWNPGLPHCRRILYQLSPQGKPRISLVETNSWVIPQIWHVCPESYHPRHWDNEPRETHGSWAFTHPHSSMDLGLSCSKQANPSDGIHGGLHMMDRWMVQLLIQIAMTRPNLPPMGIITKVLPGVAINVCGCVQAQLWPNLCNPMDCSLPGSPVHGILLARILEPVALASSKGSSSPRDQTRVSCIGRWILYHWATREAHGQAYNGALRT